MTYEVEGVAKLEERVIEGEEGQVRVEVKKPRFLARNHDEQALAEYNDSTDEGLQSWVIRDQEASTVDALGCVAEGEVDDLGVRRLGGYGSGTTWAVEGHSSGGRGGASV